MTKHTRRDKGQGSVYKETGRDRWIGRITIDGKRHRVTAKTKTGARERLKAIRAAADAGQPVAPADLTVGALLEQWQAKALPNSTLAPSTIGTHRWACQVITNDIGTRRVQTLTADDVEAMLQRRADAGAAKATIHKLRGTLSKALGWAHRRGVIARNVARLAELPATARPAVAGRTMTPEQAARFIAAADASNIGAMFVTMILTGLRPGEAAALSWHDVELDAGVIHVRSSIRRQSDGSLIVGPTKTAHSVRSLDAGEQVLAAIRRQRKQQAAARLAAGELWHNPDELVFTTAVGTPLDSKAINRELRRVIAAAGLDDDWSAVDLRHTAASLMSHSGLPIELVADQLGHRDTRMVSMHYRHRVARTVGAGKALDDMLADTANSQ